MVSVTPLRPSKTTLGAGVEAFFADRDLAPATRRAYRATYDPLLEAYGTDLPIEALTEARLRRWITCRWGQAAPATWNVRLTATRVLIGYCRRQGWLEGDPTASLERRRIPRDETRAIPFEALDALWSRPDIALREKVLWRMLYATAARASEILALDVEDLDLGRKRAAIAAKGGHREVVVWDAATARLLPRYLAGRRQGPVFVTAGLPNVVPAEPDRSPDGRGRLSYQRAWSVFREASGGQWTLHQLRHSALTHLGEDDVSAPLLMAKSRHRDLRTLSRYVRPGIEAVARLTAEHDRARRWKPPRR
jgi:integrase/recombinase XerC/integrase/recombinase XerD